MTRTIIKCDDCDLNAEWILQFDDKYIPLCGQHFDEWCHLEGEINLDFWLIANICSGMSMREFLNHINNKLDRWQLQYKWARDEIKKLKNNSSEETKNEN